MIEGIIGKKIGMARVYTKEGEAVAVSAIEAGPCVVTQVKTSEKEGYNAAQLGFGEAKKITAPEKGHLKGLGQFRYLREFRLTDAKGIETGQKIDVSVFKAGDLVSVMGITKGKGFAGGVKRYHFRGGPKTHGQSDRHRAPGSLGPDIPNRVLKGQKMAGHMGHVQLKALNLEVVQADPARNLLLVKGAVPGGENALLVIQKSTRRK
ncbi:MAG: 50S ribosomal protein L3 [Dehalococcoidales bacterium]|nr:50S ribosomal protein L3 [Dehalococcoidales bacterium]